MKGTDSLSMPLVRYRLGDLASLSAKPCECGRRLPVLNHVVGRAYDMVYNREGRMFHGEFFVYIFEEVKRRGFDVRAFQVIQQNADTFTIKIQPGSNYGPEAEELIRQGIRNKYGHYAKVEFVRVEGIEREKSGKMRLIVRMTRAGSRLA